MTFFALLILGTLQAAERPPAYELYIDIYHRLEDASIERSCRRSASSPTRSDVEAIYARYASRLKFVDRAIQERYPAESENAPPIGGMARSIDCVKMRGAEARFRKSLTLLENYLGVR